MKTGHLIALEGIDGSGLTTQADLLGTWLSRDRRGVAVTKEPTEGPVGQMIRSALRGDLAGSPPSESMMALLFAADRLDHARRYLNPRRESGDIVITDRYLLSTYAYQSMTLPLDWLRSLNHEAPRPDLTLLVVVDPETSAKRMANRTRRERYETTGQLTRVLENYVRLAELLKDELNVRTIDGTLSRQAVFAALQAEIRKLL